MKRPLALIVGAPSPQRDATSSLLIEQGMAVVVCAGPPGCILEREDRCVLRDAGEVTILFGGRTPHRLQACAACGPGSVIAAGTHPIPDLIAGRARDAAAGQRKEP